MRVLVACEFSGIVREAFLRRGHVAMSCDLLDTEQPGYELHYEGDVMDVLNDGWDLMIAHPPCTYLAVAGLQYLKTKPGRIEKQVEAGNFARQLWEAPIPRICIENPIGQLPKYIGRYTQIVRMWQFGHADAHKPTCLWLKNLPPLKSTNEVAPDKSRQYPNGKVLSPWRAKNVKAVDRSRTFLGLAEAMAEQWGDLNVQ